jgi:hypothetical protein
MKKFIFAMVGLVVFSAMSTANAQELRGAAFWTGFFIEESPGDNIEFCPANPAEPCVGDLVTCPTGSRIFPEFGEYQFIDGICSDLDPSATACGGRFTFYSESCFNTATDEVITEGMVVDYSPMPALARTCFDNTAAGDCSGPVPAGIVVGESEWISQFRVDINQANQGVSVAQGQSFFDVVNTVRFLDPVDGKRKKLLEGSGVDHFTFQVENCGGATACGEAGATIMLVTKGKR